MPWCGIWGATGVAYWWILPLIGLVFMGVMFLVCFRGFGCMGGRRPTPRGASEERDRSVEADVSGCCGPRPR